jgi:putative transposase
MSDKYLVDLTAAEQVYLAGLLKHGKSSARKIARAHILLQAAEGLSDEEIADTLRVGRSTIHRTRQRFVEEGLEPTLNERRRASGRPKLAGKQEAFLVALACSTPPAGRARWTTQLLADRLVELTAVGGISDETVRRALKKRAQTLATQGVVHSQCESGLCLAYGRCLGPVCGPL